MNPQISTGNKAASERGCRAAFEGDSHAAIEGGNQAAFEGGSQTAFEGGSKTANKGVIVYNVPTNNPFGTLQDVLMETEEQPTAMKATPKLPPINVSGVYNY